jgi:hypothetical protein
MENSATVRTNHDQMHTPEKGVEEGIIMEEITQHETVKKEFPPTNSATTSVNKLTFKEYLGAEWRDHFRKDKTIKEILHASGIDDQIFVSIEKTYAIDDDRLALIIKTKNKGTFHSNWIMLDVIMGEPTWDQMMDIAFGIGVECNPRIVVYDSGGDPDFYIEYRVAGFTQISNDCGLNTLLVASNALPTGITYSLLTDYALYGSSDLEEFPTREEFQKTELICNLHTVLGFDPPLEMEYFNWPCESIIWFIEDSDLELTYPVWNKNGLFMRLTATSQRGRKQLKWLLENKQDEIKKAVGDFSVECDESSGLPQELLARIWDKPFSEYVFSRDMERYELAKRVVEMNKADRFFFYELLQGSGIA